jgi:hypothetical protein
VEIRDQPQPIGTTPHQPFRGRSRLGRSPEEASRTIVL